MTIETVSIQRFDLPLCKPLVIGTQTLTSRTGLMLELTDEYDRVGIGECSPLPGLHRENLDQADQQLQTLNWDDWDRGDLALSENSVVGPKASVFLSGKDDEAGDIERIVDATGRRPDEQRQLPLSDSNKSSLRKQAARSQIEFSDRALFPSVRNAIEMALWDMTAGKELVSVVLNGLLTDECDSWASLMAEGYRCLKVKVGRQSLERDIERINVLKTKFHGKVALRLDANRIWTLSQACEFGRAVGPEGIDYIEEPTRHYDDHAAFIRETGLAVAWDESLRSAEPPPGVAALILKPAILGGIKKTQAWIQWAQAHDTQVVLSSCFEGPWALRNYARLAHQHSLSEIPQGLDTWRWLDLDWADYGLRMERGRLWIQF